LLFYTDEHLLLLLLLVTPKSQKREEGKEKRERSVIDFPMIDPGHVMEREREARRISQGTTTIDPVRNPKGRIRERQ
jgi:hypothetical protein